LKLAACRLLLVAWALFLKPAQVTNVNFLHSFSGSSTHKFFFLDQPTPGYLCSSGGGALTDPWSIELEDALHTVFSQ
jgi:hypothetical protein